MRRVKPGPAINAVFSRERLLRTETDDGFPAGSSELVERPAGEWVLRITDLPVLPVPETRPINIILDAPPGLTGVPGRGRLVDIQTDDGKSIGSNGWHPRPDGKWSMRITELPVIEPKKPWEMEEQPWLRHTFEDKE